MAALGGLYVIGTNRHESRRIDDQLRGRAGRQGDPGSSRFFVSLEDDLIVRHGGDDWLPGRARPAAQPEPVEDPVLRRAVPRVQHMVEGQNFEVRHTLWRYSHFVEQQRRIIWEKRRQALLGTITLHVLRERVPAAYERASQVLGEEILRDVERRLTLQAVDECWSEHLATVTEIRDSIHLVEVCGLSPLEEFQKQAAESFDRALDSMDTWLVERFTSLEITSDGVDLGKLGLLGASSMWTYLVNDHAFTDRLAATLVSRHAIGFAAGAAFNGPLLLLWGLQSLLPCRWQRRGRR